MKQHKGQRRTQPLINQVSWIGLCLMAMISLVSCECGNTIQPEGPQPPESTSPDPATGTKSSTPPGGPDAGKGPEDSMPPGGPDAGKGPEDSTPPGGPDAGNTQIPITQDMLDKVTASSLNDHKKETLRKVLRVLQVEKNQANPPKYMYLPMD